MDYRKLTQGWSRIRSWLADKFRKSPETQVYVHYSQEKPPYQKLNCENVVRSSLGPMGQQGRRRR